MIPKPPMRFRSDGEALIPCNDTAAAFVKRREGEQSTMAEGGHSKEEHGLLFSFTEYLWMLHWTEKFPEYENFRYYLSVCVGHCDLKLRLHADKHWENVMVERSWSFPACNFQRFDQLTHLVSQWAEKHHGITIEAWKENDRDAMRRWTRTKRVELGVKGGIRYKLKTGVTG